MTTSHTTPTTPHEPEPTAGDLALYLGSRLVAAAAVIAWAIAVAGPLADLARMGGSALPWVLPVAFITVVVAGMAAVLDPTRTDAQERVGTALVWTVVLITSAGVPVHAELITGEPAEWVVRALWVAAFGVPFAATAAHIELLVLRRRRPARQANGGAGDDA
jgi:hypothetical protein